MVCLQFQQLRAALLPLGGFVGNQDKLDMQGLEQFGKVTILKPSEIIK